MAMSEMIGDASMMPARRGVELPAGDRLRGMCPVVVAHGTRSAQGLEVIAEIVEGVAARVGATRTAFVDVLGPTPSEVIVDAEGPVILVPAFLASGYHVRQDIPVHVSEAGRSDTVVTRALGPDSVLASVQRLRLIEAGWTPGDVVVLAAAGSSDPQACGQAHLAARRLENIIGGRVEVGFVTTAEPTVEQALARARVRAGSGRSVVISPYLLAPGVFHRRLHDVGADLVAEPLGADPRICDLIVTRMRAAISPYRREVRSPVGVARGSVGD